MVIIMCGIVGMFDLKGQRRVSGNVLTSMLNVLDHRGPNETTFHVENDLGMGFKRLSIIDLNTGMQPIYNEDKSIILICNGEIFNYRELKKEQVLRGHLFRTKTDVEVLLHLYEDYGTEMFSYINGQFSFAIYDRRKNTLFCARDHIGIAPFFYGMFDGMFIFASEIKALLEYKPYKRKVDLVGMDQVLTLPGLVSPRTMFEDIFSLPAGHYILVKMGQTTINSHEYWDIHYKADEVIYEGEEKCADELRQLLLNSISKRLEADVPVGFYLSGGLDSSTIASLIHSLTPDQKWSSFSIFFEDGDISERSYQHMMAEYIGSNHHEKLFTLANLVENLKDAVYYSECALKETYNTASMVLSSMAREAGIRVILTGEGADELFGGYVGYKFDKIRIAQKDIQVSQEERDLRRFLWGDEDFMYEKDYTHYRKIKQNLYSDSVRARGKSVDCFQYPLICVEKLKEMDMFQRRSYIDIKCRMIDHLLADHGDRMAYRNSIECRYPFLDKEILDFATKIPSEYKLKGFNEKYILKEAVRGVVPDKILNRSKFSFVAPGSPSILRLDSEYINDLLSYERIKRQGYFNPNIIEKYRHQYSQEGFRLNLPFETDIMIFVITFCMFLDIFDMPNLN